MIHPTPKQYDLVEQSRSTAIKSAFSDYEITFVILHPFLKIKPWYNIAFGSWPTKKQIISYTQNVTWAEIIQQADLQDIRELDRLLAFWYRDRRTADRKGWIQLKTMLDTNNTILPEVGYLPSSLTNPIMSALQLLGYSAVDEFDFTLDWAEQHEISSVLLSEEISFATVARVLTPDKKIVIATDYAQRFSYLSASIEIVSFIIDKANLEGFYCNDTTKPEWSDIVQVENTIDWSSPERTKNYS